jgi:hypothetical protein
MIAMQIQAAVREWCGTPSCLHTYLLYCTVHLWYSGRSGSSFREAVVRTWQGSHGGQALDQRFGEIAMWPTCHQVMAYQGSGSGSIAWDKTTCGDPLPDSRFCC